MSTVDEILHGGEYTDRRGRRWMRSHFNNWTAPRPPRVSALADESQMRQLIERDQHRDVCPGLDGCGSGHPVVRVETMDGYYFTYDARESYFETMHDTLPEAIDAARALAVKL